MCPVTSRGHSVIWKTCFRNVFFRDIREAGGSLINIFHVILPRKFHMIMLHQTALATVHESWHTSAFKLESDHLHTTTRDGTRCPEKQSPCRRLYICLRSFLHKGCALWGWIHLQIRLYMFHVSCYFKGSLSHMENMFWEYVFRDIREAGGVPYTYFSWHSAQIVPHYQHASDSVYNSPLIMESKHVQTWK